ncbi:integrin alpha-PS1 isoform X2 [Chrysoperla carnea]|uniref:integrin alpha-PS1 isoform X2 n=1 Tax=Chrysoperla carnea TaxID=189513 RepID=UPI001D0881BB|nr:integrin alpha-PS1 isoform X2 [Chrysoperla carnea]
MMQLCNSVVQFKLLKCCVIQLLYLFLMIFECTNCFNLEYRVPIIKIGYIDHYDHTTTYSLNNTYFGYSVAEHQVKPEDENEASYSLLLAGAPLGNNLQPNTSQSGALYKCPITANPFDCMQVITDGRKSDDLNDPKFDPPLPSEIKNGQWLGVVVRSQGDIVLVCAHRYMVNYWGNGMCYSLNNDLTLDSNLEPCNGRTRARAHEDFGYCQAGTSGALLKDGTVILGAPGPRTWRGTIFVTDMGGDYLDRDKTVYHGPIDMNCSYIDNYSYLGMSVAAGNFFMNKTAYAAGGPRSNNTGQVIIFSKHGSDSELKVGLILNGDQLASHFGYEMAAADINGDGLQDLIVAAPFHFGKHEGGAVYVYKNSNEKCNLTCEPPLILTGKPDSRFGFAITSLGDLNKDGYEDIAIGAPYEGSGVIYIYLGSKNGLLKEPSQRIAADELPLFKIRGKVFGPIKTLGYSLSGGIDMDNNGYPDLLVGAYEKDAVVLFRARPIIDIQTKIKQPENLVNIDASKTGCLADPNSNYTCFSFHACCQIMSLDAKTQSDLQILNYTIEAETFAGNRKFSRVWFGRDPNKPHIIHRKIEIVNITKFYCDQHTVYLKENTRDILSPIKFRLNYTLQQQVPKYSTKTLPIIDNYPILNQQEAEKIFNATFQKDCGANDICESDINIDAAVNLTRLGDKYILTLGLEKEVKLIVKIANKAEPAYEAQLFISHPKSLTYIASSAEEKQVLCNPHNDSMVVCGLGNPFKSDHDATVTLRFDPKPINDALNEFKFIVFANSTSVEDIKKDPTEIFVSILKNAEVSIKGSATRTNIIYGGEIKGESAMKYGDDVGSNVTHLYQVVNNGPWKVAQLTVEVFWPYQVANNKPQGKWLLYLEKPPIVEATNGGGGECYLTGDQINPLNLTSHPGAQEAPLNLRMGSMYSNYQQYQPQRRRTRRDTEVIIKSHKITDKDGFKREVVTMDCNAGTAKCIRFNCTIYNLPRYETAVVLIRARLWNSTLVEDYPKVDWVNIRSRAKIHIPPEYSIQQNTSDDEALVEMLAYPDLINQQDVEPIPLWIIILAIIIGLIILILFTFILWKMGFFKRKRPDPTLSGNLEKHHEESPFLRRHER